jgi:hypothetical protein
MRDSMSVAWTPAPRHGNGGTGRGNEAGTLEDDDSTITCQPITVLSDGEEGKSVPREVNMRNGQASVSDN